MKKTISLILTCCLLFLFAGCDNSSAKKPASPSNSSSSPSASADASSADSSSKEQENETEKEKEDTVSNRTQSENSTAGNENVNASVNNGAGKTESNNSDKNKTDTVNKERAVDKLTRGINLSGPLEGAGDINYDSWIFKSEYYALLVDGGFDHVRIPVNFGNHIGEAPDYYIDTEFMRAVDIAVNNALEAGLVAVLDFHGWNGTLASDFNGNKDCFYKIWEQVSKRYQTYPEELMFELINEPNKPITDAQLNELQLETVKRIRKLNPTRTIALATNENNGTWKLWNTQVPANDDNLIISIHNYDTMAFTHQGADWLGDGYKNKIAFDDNIKSSVKKHIEQCRYYEERTGRKVWISEWGVYQGIADKDDISQYADYFSGICRENKISYCYWEFCSGYGVYDINAGAWKEFLLNNLH